MQIAGFTIDKKSLYHGDLSKDRSCISISSDNTAKNSELFEVEEPWPSYIGGWERSDDDADKRPGYICYKVQHTAASAKTAYILKITSLAQSEGDGDVLGRFKYACYAPDTTQC